MPSIRRSSDEKCRRWFSLRIADTFHRHWNDKTFDMVCIRPTKCSILNVCHIRWMTSKTLDKIAKHYQIALDSDLDDLDVVGFFFFLHLLFSIRLSLCAVRHWCGVVRFTFIMWPKCEARKVTTMKMKYSRKVDRTVSIALWLSYKRFEHGYTAIVYQMSTHNTFFFFSLSLVNRQAKQEKKLRTVPS